MTSSWAFTEIRVKFEQPPLAAVCFSTGKMNGSSDHASHNRRLGLVRFATSRSGAAPNIPMFAFLQSRIPRPKSRGDSRMNGLNFKLQMGRQEVYGAS